MRRLLVIIGVAVLIAAGWFAYRLGVGLDLWQPLRRPPNVPRQARYVVTWTRSAWFDCTVDQASAADLCRAWDDAGRLIAQGRYRLEDEGRPANAAELKPSMVQVYPGHPELSWIFLKGERGIFSKTLVPIDNEGKPLEGFRVHVQ